MRSPWRVALLALVLLCAAVPGAQATFVRTVAGGGPVGPIGPANSWHKDSSLLVGLGAPQAVEMDHTTGVTDGLDYYVADTTGCRILKVDAGTEYGGAVGPIDVVVGLMETCRDSADYDFNHEYNGASFPPSGNEPKLKNPGQLASLADGRLIWSENGQGRVDQLGTDNYIDTVVGTGTCGAAPDTSTAAASANLCNVTGLAAHPTTASKYLISDGGTGRVIQMDGTNVITVAGGCHDGANPAFAACLSKPEGVTYLNDSAFLVVDHDAGKVWLFSTTDDTLATVVASGLSQPADVAPAYDGGFYVTEEGTCQVEHVADLSGSGAKIVVAGSTCGGPSGDDGEATAAKFPHPLGIASYPSGLLIADPAANTVRRVERTSIVTAPPDYTNVVPFDVQPESLDVDADIYCELIGAATVEQFADPCTTFGTNLPDDNYTYHAETKTPSDSTINDWQSPFLGWMYETGSPTAANPVSPDDGAGDLSPRPTFSWTAANDLPKSFGAPTSGIGRYDVLVDGTKAASTLRVGDTLPATSAQAETGLPEGQHTWRVRTYDRAGNFTDGPTRTLTTTSPPSASLSVGPNRALIGTNVTFDGSGSSDPDGPLAKYEWDFESDGTFDVTGPDAKVTHSFSTPGDFTATLRVTDGVGRTATATATYTITAPTVQPGQVGVTINNGAQYTNKPDVTIFLKPPPSTTQVLLSNDGGFLAPAPFAPAAQVPWKLDSSGPERLPKTVYVRFLNGSFTLATLTDDIILDERPPVVSQAALDAPASSARVAKLKTWKLNVKATDSNSGVAGVQVTANKKKPGKLIAYKRKLKVKLPAKPKFLRAKDKAGNFSGWKKIR